MLKNKALYWLRKLRLMHLVDRINFFLHRYQHRSGNKKFRKEHPGIKLPPAYVLYEAHRMDYDSYYKEGRNTAAWVVKQLSAYIPDGHIKILDWGCGPARVVRHLPELLPLAGIYGSDYNPETIAWCRQNIAGVEFNLNTISPPLPYKDNFFHAIYALSVFTHLSVSSHYEWISELARILRPGGILLLTTQGEAFTIKLTEAEKRTFHEGKLVVRDKVLEGHRSFSAFQPESFMNKFFSGSFNLLKLEKGELFEWGPEQDAWIVQKKIDL
jgi:SAM-dependent methyltransferase